MSHSSSSSLSAHSKTLDETQQLAIHLSIERRQNLFLTGQAGVGKSHCVGSVVQAAWIANLNVILTATTGIAAMNLYDLLPKREDFIRVACADQGVLLDASGQKKRKRVPIEAKDAGKTWDKQSVASAPSTIHKFALLKPNEYNVEEACRRIAAKKWAMQRWLQVDVWVIDEVSMLSPVLFSMLDQMARKLRNRVDIPFGGITMLFVGDFYQLPPVMINQDEIALAGGAQYCFETQSWVDTVHYELVLEKIYRQGKDQTFVQVLQEVRSAQLSEQSIEILKSRTRGALYDELVAFDGQDASEAAHGFNVDEFLRRCKAQGILVPKKFTPLISTVEPTRLMAINKQVDAENESRLAAIHEPLFTYSMITRCDGRGVQSVEQSNAIISGLTSGIMAPSTLELKKGAQVMLLVNKTATLVNGRRGVVLDFLSDEQFEEQQQYSSETKQGKSESDEPLKKKTPKFEIDQSTYMRVANKSADEKLYWPLVLFDNGEKMLVKPHRWDRECKQPSWYASATQIPLKLAWAISIHKAQGMTISMLQVDLCHVFTNGQAYVALSRAQSLDGLLLESFDSNMCTDPCQAPNALVVEYYKKMIEKQKEWKPRLQAFLRDF